MLRPGFFRIFLVLVLLYGGFWAYRVYQYQPPANPPVSAFMPYGYKEKDEKYPLVVFSHGFLGCPRQSIFLIQALTRRGYVVLAPRHRDATCGDDEGNKFLMSFVNLPTAQKYEVSFMKPEEWHDETEADRRRDIAYTLEMAAQDPDISPYVDQDAIGLMGHSLGGYTVLGLAGAQESWKDKRIKSVAALTPYVPPYLVQGGLKSVDIPVMIHSGKKDRLTPSWLVRSAYHMLGGDKYYVEFQQDGHLAWMDLGSDKHKKEIADYTVAFFNATLKKQEQALLSEQDSNDVLVYRYETK